VTKEFAFEGSSTAFCVELSKDRNEKSKNIGKNKMAKFRTKEGNDGDFLVEYIYYFCLWMNELLGGK
jgi:hypothetical protein